MHPFRVWHFLMAACLSLGVMPADGAGRVFTYIFVPQVTPAGTVLHVTLNFRGGAGPADTVEVPTEWAGETLRGIVNLRALSRDTTIADAPTPGQKLVRHPPHREVTLTYDIVKDWTGPFRHPAEFHGALLPEYIEVNGSNALVRPSLTDQTQATVHFDWRKLPATWVLATSFGLSPRQSYTGAWSTVEHALFTAGQFRIHHFRIGAEPAILAIREKWSFTDDEAIAAFQKTIGIVRDFWRDHRFPYYLVTVKAFDDDKGNQDGSEFTNAFWLYLSRQDSLSSQLVTMIHETFHAWDPGSMGRLSGADDSAVGWFKEGFTRYYASLLALRGGVIDLPAYTQEINRDLRDSPRSTDIYVRGRLIALWLDREIRKESQNKNSLDNVMFDMVSGASRPLTEARIFETAGRYLSPQSRSQLAQAVEPGARIPTADDALGPCVHGSVDRIAPFDLGFNFDASQQVHKVVGVVPNGPAFQAGLRDGQEMAGYSVYNGQPDRTAKIKIRTGETRKTIEYYPRDEPVPVMPYHLNERTYNQNPAGCLDPIQ